MVKPPLDLLEKPKVEKPKELTLEEKIAQNINKCTDNQWVRADNAECLDKPVYSPVPSTTTNKAQYTNTAGNTYTPGYCTWYVKNKRPDIPNMWGNASEWLRNAQRQNWPTGSSPAQGAVGWNSGHVVYVESVNGDGTVTISEMNWNGPWSTNTRTVSSSAFMYIY